MPKRILIFNVNWLGDVLFSTAVIRNLRRNFRESYLACIIPSRCYAVLKDNPYLDEIIIYDEKDRHRGVLAKLSFIGYLKSKRFDTAFLLHRSASRALICWMAGIPERIGYYTPKRGFLLTKKIAPIPQDSLHRIDYYLNIIEKAGVRVEDRFSDFFVSDNDREAAVRFLQDNGINNGDFLVGINPGGNWMPKRWPKEYWARLADMLIEKLDARVVITGSPSDIALAGDIRLLMKERPLVACGNTNLKQFAALAIRMDLFISADSGPLHIANAAGCKNIIAIFGPTSLKVTSPYPLKNVRIMQKEIGCVIPCYSNDCRENRCMLAVIPDDVFRQASEIKGKT
ncbi:MAG: lipopolysaccharide heptosyltransferase II [Candidatus Omnitrophota bacterium]|jgi:lipopolysaccharide heptosyltransferase II